MIWKSGFAHGINDSILRAFYFAHLFMGSFLVTVLCFSEICGHAVASCTEWSRLPRRVRSSRPSPHMAQRRGYSTAEDAPLLSRSGSSQCRSILLHPSAYSLADAWRSRLINSVKIEQSGMRMCMCCSRGFVFSCTMHAITHGLTASYNDTPVNFLDHDRAFFMRLYPLMGLPIEHV